MTPAVFISYARADMEDTDWLRRLRMYLAPLSRRGAVDPWDDGRIATGARWREEIDQALDSAAAAVLLVGPGFLASDFVMEQELPVLLQAARDARITLFPLVVGFCGYNTSELQPYQAHNSPDEPLESLPKPEQNRILNSLAIAVDKTLRSARPQPPLERVASAGDGLYQTMLYIQRNLGDTGTAVRAQFRRRDALVAAIEQRLHFTNTLEYEKFFFRYHNQLTKEERPEFDQIRAITEGPLQTGNRKILEAIDANPAVLDLAPQMVALRQHLVFWLNKYDKVFVNNMAMCLLYTGVEDGVPFPPDADATVAAWLAEHKPADA